MAKTSLFRRIANRVGSTFQVTPATEIAIEDGMKRPKSLRYSPFVRVTNDIANAAASLIAKTLYVEDEDGVRRDTRSMRQKLRVLRTSWDGGATDARHQWKQQFLDFLVEGNSLMVPYYRGDALEGVRVMDAYGAEYLGGSNRYRGNRRVPGGITASMETFPAADVAHARWGHYDSGRSAFSIAPIRQLRDNILTAQSAELWAQKYFNRTYKTNAIFTPPPGVRVGKDDINKMTKSIERYLRGDAPLMTSRAFNITTLDQKATDQELMALLDYEKNAVADMYGYPEELLTSGTTTKVGESYDKYWRSALEPAISTMLSALSNRMLRDGLHFTVDETASILRGSASERTALLNVLRPNTGVMPLYTVNEIRKKMGDPPLTDEEREQMLEEHADFFARSKANSGSEDANREESDANMNESEEDSNED